METILGKSPAIFNGHQPPRADYPYMKIVQINTELRLMFLSFEDLFEALPLLVYCKCQQVLMHFQIVFLKRKPLCSTIGNGK